MNRTLEYASRLVIVITLALLPSVTYAATQFKDVVCVELTRFARAQSVKVSATRGLLSADADGCTISSSVLEFSIHNGKLLCRHSDVVPPLVCSRSRIVPQTPDGAIILESALRNGTYAGGIDIGLDNGRMRIANEVGIEEYVQGVLPAEMPDLYPNEALKAQAVVVRTYALINRNKHAASGCDVCDSTHCQLYSGIVSGKPHCHSAVADTKGLVLTYAGRLAHVQYSADGGGATQDYAALYNKPEMPYLCGVQDPEGVPHTSWQKSYALRELETLLVGAGVKQAAGLQSLRIAAGTQSGRVISVEVTGSEGSAQIPATKLRGVLGPDVFKSTLFAIGYGEDSTVTFQGKGYGHGIGLCQTGCKGLAQSPFNYSWQQILAHYFPGTTVSTVAGLQAANALPQAERFLPSPTPKPAPQVLSKPSMTKLSPSRRHFPRPMMDLKLIDPGQL